MVIKYHISSDTIPAGLVEEKVLVWFFNAFENCTRAISPSSVHSTSAYGRLTRGPAVNRRIAIEDMLEISHPN